MYISPVHNIAGFTLEDLENVDYLIDIFEAKIDGWYLEVADKCINGWVENEKQCISTVDRQGRAANYVPDSGFAVLMIVFGYFELIGLFKLGSKKNVERKIEAGIRDVFPEFGLQLKALSRKIYEIRNDLYHMGSEHRGFILQHTVDSLPISLVVLDENETIAVIDPHKLIPRLRTHLSEYCAALRNEANIELRDRFQKEFRKAYVREPRK